MRSRSAAQKRFNLDGRQPWRLTCPCVFILVLMTGIAIQMFHTSISFAADMASNHKSTETQSVLDEIFGPTDDCAPRGNFWYDDQNRSILDGKTGILEALGAKAREELIYPNDGFPSPIKVLHFKFKSSFYRLPIIEINFTTLSLGADRNYTIIFSPKVKKEDILKNVPSNDLYFSIFKNNDFHGSRANNLAYIVSNRGKIIYTCTTPFE